MSWQEAKADAEVTAARMLERIRAAGGEVGEIQLAEYRDLESYQQLKPGEPWPWRHHLAVIRAVARLLRRAKYRVRLIPLGLSDYLDFLAAHELQNTPANRAQFISWATAPEPKPSPKKDWPGRG